MRFILFCSLNAVFFLPLCAQNVSSYSIHCSHMHRRKGPHVNVWNQEFAQFFFFFVNFMFRMKGLQKRKLFQKKIEFIDFSFYT